MKITSANRVLFRLGMSCLKRRERFCFGWFFSESRKGIAWEDISCEAISLDKFQSKKKAAVVVESYVDMHHRCLGYLYKLTGASLWQEFCCLQQQSQKEKLGSFNSRMFAFTRQNTKCSYWKLAPIAQTTTSLMILANVAVIRSNLRQWSEERNSPEKKVRFEENVLEKLH